ncbi:MAG TPA: ankyrin repeat domain-containing protein [Pyrinomonadaceae bacterium]|nr:ankyrin repeat domain-containing protein [Pyrinomonadaceae bacterium]
MKIILGLILCASLTGTADGAFRPTQSRPPCGQLISAVLEGKLDRVKQALKEGVNANCKDDDGSPAVIVAASRQQGEIVKALLAGGADPNVVYDNPARGLRRSPAVVFAAANGDLNVLSALLSAGADVNARDSGGLTPLMSAAYMGHDEIVRALVEKGAKLEEKDENGYTALMFAANRGEVGATKALLRAGAQVNARDNGGSTPVMFAAQHGYDLVVMLLLRRGADPRVKGSHGLSAVEFARQHNHPETVRILENPNLVAMVRVNTKGMVSLNGKNVTLGELKAEFVRLKKSGGVVWYYRENPEAEEPPPQALQVIKLVTQAELPIVLLEVDFE